MRPGLPRAWYATPTAQSGISEVYVGQPRGLGGLGVLGALGCKELNVAVDRLGVALQVATNKTSPAYLAGKAFFDREDSLFGSTWFVGAESCANLVAEANRLTAAINAELPAGQVVAPTQQTLEKSVGTGEWIGLVKWIVAGVGVIAVVWLGGPFIRAGAQALAKKVKK